MKAAQHQRLLAAGLAITRALLLLAVMLLWPENRVWAFTVAPQIASGQTAHATPLAAWETVPPAADPASGCCVAAEEAASAGPNIALGYRIGGLRTFASDIGADHLLDVPEAEFKSVFQSYVDNPATTFHVNMNGFIGDSTEEMINNEIGSGSYTGYELQQLNAAGRLPQVNFYQNGAGTLVPNPF